MFTFPSLKIRDYIVSIYHISDNINFLYLKLENFQIPLATVYKDFTAHRNYIVNYYEDIAVDDAVKWWKKERHYRVKNKVLYDESLNNVLNTVVINCTQSVIEHINIHYNAKRLLSINDNTTHYNLNPAYFYDRNSKIIPKKQELVEESLFKNRISELIYLMKAADDKNDLKEAYKYLDLLIEELNNHDE